MLKKCVDLFPRPRSNCRHCCRRFFRSRLLLFCVYRYFYIYLAFVAQRERKWRPWRPSWFMTRVRVHVRNVNMHLGWMQSELGSGEVWKDDVRIGWSLRLMEMMMIGWNRWFQLLKVLVLNLSKVVSYCMECLSLFSMFYIL